ncbi:MAG: decarboxylating 6-phosphogluconate dehydrogenase [Cytophagales bacterium]|nr:decarboxylating 6-phosphogluconate dehydrogenase [Armatimonadota bacterium]
MEIGFVGLGRMGGNMAQRLHEKGHTVFGSDPAQDVRSHAEENGVAATDTVPHLANKFTQAPRVFWAMVPAGRVTDAVVAEIATVAAPGDIVIDGGNSNYHDSQRRHAELKAKGLHFLDVGTSGGVWGLKNGYCLMVGGDKVAFDAVEPLLRDLAPPEGLLYAGPSGAGHFVKMVHNGIEYGLMQAYAEGFELLSAAKEFGFDLSDVAHLWNQGSVVRSWLLELAERALAAEGDALPDIKGWVEDSGEGRWTVEESIDRAVPLPVIALSLQMRFRSRQDNAFGPKLIAALRNQFGGHAITAAEKAATGEPQPSGGQKDL